MSDMKDLKFRVPQSPVLIASTRLLAAAPPPDILAETFTALQQGVVDGQCYGYIGFKAAEVQREAKQKYLTEVHYTYQLQPLVMSERVYKKNEARTPGNHGQGRHLCPGAERLQYQKEEAQVARLTP